MRAHLRGRHVAGINRRITGSEHRQDRRLRTPEVQGHFVVTLDGDVGDVRVPILARVLAQLVLRFTLNQIESALHVGGGERLAVMPFDAVPQLEGQFLVVFAPGPAGRQLGHDRVHAVLRLMLVVDDEVVEHTHRRSVHRKRRLFEDRHARRCFAMIKFENAAVLRFGGLRAAQTDPGHHSRRQRNENRSHRILPVCRPAALFALRRSVSCFLCDNASR